MALRWRADGRLLCAAKHPAENDDTYINDGLHYRLSVVARVIMADVNEEENGLWHWVHGDGGLLLRAVSRESGA